MRIIDQGGRRSGTERRQILVQINFPDRRLSKERRSGVDRRSSLDRRSKKRFRSIVGMDRRKMLKKHF